MKSFKQMLKRLEPKKSKKVIKEGSDQSPEKIVHEVISKMSDFLEETTGSEEFLVIMEDGIGKIFNRMGVTDDDRESEFYDRAYDALSGSIPSFKEVFETARENLMVEIQNILLEIEENDEDVPGNYASELEDGEEFEESVMSEVDQTLKDFKYTIAKNRNFEARSIKINQGKMTVEFTDSNVSAPSQKYQISISEASPVGIWTIWKIVNLAKPSVEIMSGSSDEVKKYISEV